MGEKVTFPNLSKKNENIIQNGTEKLFHFLNLKDFVRMDWRCDNKGNVFFLEANTLAGLSYFYSVLPLMAKEYGLNYLEFFSVLAESALTRKNSRNLWYGKTRIQNK
jgi:D-alanine-D-alanine ligase